MRVESSKKLSNGGYLHPIGDKPPPRPVLEHKSDHFLNVQERLDSWSQFRYSRRLDDLSVNLGVTRKSLEMLECVHAPYRNTWAWPMRDGNNGLIGIRLRNLDGKKWAERGSHQGLFIPQTEPQKTVYVCEGPTDTAALLSIGCYAIGRPSCCGGIPMLQQAVKHFGIRRAVIVSDLDDPGLRGAQTLSMHLPIPSAILVCPCKDARLAIQNGMDKAMVDAMTNQLMWRQP